MYAVDGEGLVGRPQAKELHRLYLPLVARGYIPPSRLPLSVGAAIAKRPVAYPGEVFYSTSLRMPDELPSGGGFYFSPQRDTVAEVVVDDELALLVGGTEVFSHCFSSGGAAPEAAIVALPRATLEGLAGQTVTVAYRDVYGSYVEASDVWLIWTP